MFDVTSVSQGEERPRACIWKTFRERDITSAASTPCPETSPWRIPISFSLTLTKSYRSPATCEQGL